MLLIEMALNLLVAGGKGAYGVVSGSLAITTDAVHSLLDAAGNVLAIVALRAAWAPPDRSHPYGHQKIEIVAAAAVGVLIAAGVGRFGWESVEALRSGRAAPVVGPVGYAVVGATFAINVFVALYERRRGRQLGSAFLLSDAAHTASDVLVTSAVLLSLAAAELGVAWADPAAAIVVLVVIARVAWQVLAGNLSVLVDAAAVDADHVTQVAMLTDGVRGCHRVRSRGTDLAAHVDLHLLFENDISLRRAHRIAHEVEDALKREIPSIVDVTIHMEPEESGFETL